MITSDPVCLEKISDGTPWRAGHTLGHRWHERQQGRRCIWRHDSAVGRWESGDRDSSEEVGVIESEILTGLSGVPGSVWGGPARPGRQGWHRAATCVPGDRGPWGREGDSPAPSSVPAAAVDARKWSGDTKGKREELSPCSWPPAKPSQELRQNTDVFIQVKAWGVATRRLSLKELLKDGLRGGE